MAFGKIGKVIGAPLKAVGGLLGMGGGGSPTPETVDFDPETKAMMERKKSRADLSAGAIVGRDTAGADEAAMGFMQAAQADKPQQNAALALGPQAADLDAALAKRARRKYVDTSSMDKSRRLLKANEEVLQNQKGALEVVNMRTAQKMAQQSNALKAQAAKSAERSQMLGNVLGVAGMVGGAYLGGGLGGKK